MLQLCNQHTRPHPCCESQRRNCHLHVFITQIGQVLEVESIVSALPEPLSCRTQHTPAISHVLLFFLFCIYFLFVFGTFPLHQARWAQIPFLRARARCPASFSLKCGTTAALGTWLLRPHQAAQLTVTTCCLASRRAMILYRKHLPCRCGAREYSGCFYVTLVLPVSVTVIV